VHCDYTEIHHLMYWYF